MTRRRAGSSISSMPGSGQRRIERKGGAMADLIAIGYPDEATAQAAADEARRLAQDLIIQPDAIAVISRDTSGGYHVTTNHHALGPRPPWRLFSWFLFRLLFFLPP